jgi:transcriptional regulator with XRE-family HTH domain
MSGRGIDLVAIPDPFWQRPETIEALRKRAIGRLLLLIHHHTGASQTQIATACGMTQPKISGIMRGTQRVETLAVFERFADALEMPDSARVLLGLAPSKAAPAATPRPASRTRPGSPPAGQAIPAHSAGDVVTAAADEAAADSLRLAAEFDPGSLAWLWRESREIARATNRPALDMFATAHRIRGHALQLAERTRRPGVLSDLYVICGQVTALMASSAFDQNRWDESDSLAKSAVSYASLAGHASLQAWTLGLAALLANWRSEPDIALSHFEQGMQIAPPGEPRVRLRYIASRSYALLADSASVTNVLASARIDQDESHRHPDSLSSEVGGEFAFGQARATACAAAAWLDLGQGREAFEAARAALEALTSLPAPRRPLSQVNGARIDLATACLLNGDLGSGTQAIKPVLAGAASPRNVSLTGRLARTRTALLAPPWVKNGQARQLADEIGHWLATDAAAPARPG